tara:strand:+ start:941 stop:1642 length:702 start_codon:yes stop_codon:yes gene_type:complete
MSFGGGGGGTQTTQVTPYAPAQPALNQILSESGNLYNQGVAASGYVAPTQQTLTGLAQQEVMGTAAQNELAATLGGQYLNPFLSPLIQKAGSDIYGSVASQFSGAGRTPGSPLMQNQVASQVAQAALPMAFNTYENERARQLGVASQAPSVLQTGQQLESLQRQQQLAPFQSLQQYAGLVSPIASGFPVQSGSTNTQTNPLTSAAGGALLGSQFGGGYGALIGGGLGLLGGLL